MLTASGGAAFAVPASASAHPSFRSRRTSPPSRPARRYSGPVATYFAGGFVPPPGFATDGRLGRRHRARLGQRTRHVSAVHFGSGQRLRAPLAGQPSGDGQGRSLGNHTFARPGPYTITVTVAGTTSDPGDWQRRADTPDRQSVDLGSGHDSGLPPALATFSASLGFAKLQTLQGGLYHRQRHPANHRPRRARDRQRSRARSRRRGLADARQLGRNAQFRWRQRHAQARQPRPAPDTVQAAADQLAGRAESRGDVDRRGLDGPLRGVDRRHCC